MTGSGQASPRLRACQGDLAPEHGKAATGRADAGGLIGIEAVPTATGMSSCLLCSASLGEPVFPFSTRFEGVVYTYRTCAVCDSSTIDPLPTAAQLSAMYRQHDYHDEHYADSGQEVTASHIRELLPALKSGGRLLDFGCGNGHFLRLAADLGFVSEGCELDPHTRQTASRNSGRPVFSLDEIEESKRSYDIIHLGDVLEHLPDPTSAMRRLEKLLDTDGVFFVEGPLETNRSLVFGAARLFGTTRARLGRKSEGELPPYHLFQTNAKAQRDFFRKRLNLEVQCYDVWETGWPYLQDAPASAGARIKNAIARAAIATAALVRTAGLRMGNRFAAILAPAPR